MRFEKDCFNCGKDYIAYYEKSKYCSKECRKKREGLKDLICPVCKNGFPPTWYGQIHCDITCYSKSEKLKKEAKNSKLIKQNSEKKWHEGHLKENVGYSSLHEWVRNHKEKTGKCEICGCKESGCKNRDFDLANISGDYKRDVNDFAWLCIKCHRLFDKIKRQKLYEVIGVESKMDGKLDKIEKEKAKWLLDNRIFSKILIAQKGEERGQIVYKELQNE